MSARAPRSPGAGEVHVWWIDLSLVARSSDLLSAVERDHAARFRHPRDRQRWSRARAALRSILARYTGQQPQSLRLERGALGKPALTDPSPLRFSLTHSGDRAAVAVAWQMEVGIDLESLATGLLLPDHLDALMSFACTPDEAAWLQALPAAARHAAFLRLWTIKEAYLKGLGVGLTREPSSIEVLFPGNGGVCIEIRDLERQAIAPGPEETVRSQARPLAVHLLDAGDGWEAALAADETAQLFVFYRWPMSV